jgi:hypothetical protein
MHRNYTIFLWLLKLGSLINLYFVVSTLALTLGKADPCIFVPALVLFVVSAYRCLFPVRYENNIVFHDSVFSSIFVTRLLATFSEIAYIYLFSQVLRQLNVPQAGWITVVAWLMVVQVVISQVFVWTAVLTGRLMLYFYEEMGWALIFIANTVASAYLYRGPDAFTDSHILLELNLAFGAVYLPWQFFHLRFLHANAKRDSNNTMTKLSLQLATGIKRAIKLKNQRVDAASWGGWIGLSWMTAYWVAVIPVWVYYIVKILHAQ